MWVRCDDNATPWSRGVLVKPEMDGSWSVRLADNPLNRKTIKASVDRLLMRSEDEEEAMAGNLTVTHRPSRSPAACKPAWH